MSMTSKLASFIDRSRLGPGRLRRGFTIGVVMVIAAPAAAQQSREESAAVLEEIIVTARKREENLQSTPVSVTAFSAEGLVDRQVTNIADLGKFTPNMIFEEGANIAGSSFAVTAFIRGVGQTDFNLTIDPGVGLYVDGVYVSRSVGGLLDTVDVESVQVLRGPQGTLFGKNTIGGAVLMTSKPPSGDHEFTSEVTTGRYDRLDFRGTANVPVSEAFKLRASVSSLNRDGYVRRLSDGATMGGKDSLTGRVVALIEPSERVDLTLSVDTTRTRDEGLPSILLRVDENAPFAFFWNKALNGAVCGSPGTPTPQDNPGCYTSQWITGDPFTTWASGDNESNLDLWGASFTVDADLGWAQAKSITAYRDLDSSFDLDTAVTPLPINITQNDYSQRQVSQELQLSGTTQGERLKWLVGLYYLGESGTDRNNLELSIADFLSGGHIDNDSYAAFAQGTFSVTSALNVTLGGRYTEEDKRFRPDQLIRTDRTGGGLLLLSRCFVRDPPVVPPVPTCTADPMLNPNGNRILPYVERTASISEFTPALTVDYRLTESVLGYVGYSKGFKSGGFTQRVFPPEPVAPAFEPEFVESYEIGVKSELLDRRLRLNGAVFLADYSDLQTIVNEGIAPKVRNAGTARISGFELEGEAAVAERVRINGGVGYTDAEYEDVSPTAAPVTADYELPNAPEWSATVGVEADLWVSRAGTLRMRGDWSYKDAQFKDALNTPELRQGGYSLINASLTFEHSGGHWSLSGGATNLTDEEYLTTGFNGLGGSGAIEGAFGRPREWFLRLAYVH